MIPIGRWISDRIIFGTKSKAKKETGVGWWRWYCIWKQVGKTDTMEEMRIAFRFNLFRTFGIENICIIFKVPQSTYKHLKVSRHTSKDLDLVFLKGLWHWRWRKDLQRRVPCVHAQLRRALPGGGHRADDQAGRPRRQRGDRLPGVCPDADDGWAGELGREHARKDLWNSSTINTLPQAFLIIWSLGGRI